MFSLWYIWLLFLIPVAVRLIPQLIEARRLRKAGMREVDRMNGLQFEKYLEQLFRRQGYGVERTPYRGDQGADLILTKGGERILVQAKRYSKRVGNKAVQEAAAARPHYNCHRAIVISNQEFTGPAQELAKSNDVELWGRLRLAAMIIEVNQASQPPGAALPAPESKRPADRKPAANPTLIATPIASRQPVAAAKMCKKCGRAMTQRTGPRGTFYGCSGYPACRYTEETP